MTKFLFLVPFCNPLNLSSYGNISAQIDETPALNSFRQSVGPVYENGKFNNQML